jgi:hypothetical protein
MTGRRERRAGAYVRASQARAVGRTPPRKIRRKAKAKPKSDQASQTSAAAADAPMSAAEFREAAQSRAKGALQTLASLSEGASSEAVRVSAANAILDRAYGKPLPGAKAATSDADGEGRVLEVRWLE